MVLGHGGAVNFEAMIPGRQGERRRRTIQTKEMDLDGLIPAIGAAGIQTVPAAAHDRVINGVERELIEQVMQLCGTGVKAAAPGHQSQHAAEETGAIRSATSQRGNAGRGRRRREWR